MVRPEALVVLGATAAKALLGSDFRVTAHRGELLDSELAEIVTATSTRPRSCAAGRGPRGNREALVADLRVVARALD